MEVDDEAPRVNVDAFGMTPLMHASEAGVLDTVRTLIARGADVNARENEGRTPLMLASQEGHAGVVGLLINNEADVNAIEVVHNYTALMLAAMNDHALVVKMLLKHDANKNMKDKDEKTALDHADNDEIKAILSQVGGRRRGRRKTRKSKSRSRRQRRPLDT